MAKKNDLGRCRTAGDFISFSSRHGGQVVRQTGSHAIVKGPHGGICPIPCHGGDLANGTRHSIIKMLLAILSILSLAVACAPVAQAIW